MPNFVREIRTIRALLEGSRWATDPPVQNVIDEYTQLLGAAWVRNRIRKASLQIFFGSRAIDSLLVYVVEWECARMGRSTPTGGQRTLGRSIATINRHRVNGNRFSRPTTNRLANHLRRPRNRFAHQAGAFPTDSELDDFLTDTLAGIQEVVGWR